MNIVWKRVPCKGHASSRSGCNHGVPTHTLTPRLRAYLDKRHKVIWTVGPAIRECCVEQKHAKALVSWWADIEARFSDLEAAPDSNPHGHGILHAKQSIIAALRNVVPRSRSKKRVAICRRARVPISGQLKLLGLQWPCDAEQVKNAWKQVARELHPDRGGDQALFVKANQAQKTVLEYLEKV